MTGGQGPAGREDIPVAGIPGAGEWEPCRVPEPGDGGKASWRSGAGSWCGVLGFGGKEMGSDSMTSLLVVLVKPQFLYLLNRAIDGIRPENVV